MSILLAGVPQGYIIWPIMIFRTMSLILLSILLIQFSIVSEIELLIYESSCSWVLKLNQTFDALWIEVGNGLWISMLGKINLLRFSIWIIVVLLIRKQLGLFFQKNDLPRCWNCLHCWNLIGPLCFYCKNYLQEN